MFYWQPITNHYWCTKAHYSPRITFCSQTIIVTSDGSQNLLIVQTLLQTDTIIPCLQTTSEHYDLHSQVFSRHYHTRRAFFNHFSNCFKPNFASHFICIITALAQEQLESYEKVTSIVNQQPTFYLLYLKLCHVVLVAHMRNTVSTDTFQSLSFWVPGPVGRQKLVLTKVSVLVLLTCFSSLIQHSSSW